MKITKKIVVVFAVLVCHVTASNGHMGDYSNIERLVDGDQMKDLIDDKSNVTNLSDITDKTVTYLVKMVKDLKESYGNNLERLVRPLKNVISTIWINPLDELLQENLYLFFDKILDIGYFTFEPLENVWHGAISTMESILSDISKDILKLNEAANKIINETQYNYEFGDLSIINETVANLVISVVGLTEFITSLIRLFPVHYYKNIFAIVSSVTSLQIIHQYTVSCVACLVSKTVIVLDSKFGGTNYAAIKRLQTTITSYISKVQQIAMNNYKEATMTELINGNVNSLLSKQLLISVTDETDITYAITINALQSSTFSLYNIIRTYAESTFHILPDLLDQLVDVLFRCANVKFGKFEQLITYAFDGLLDVLHHISYDLNQDIKSSASTGSFQEPSEPIDCALDNFKMSAKHFLHSIEHITTSDDVTAIHELVTNIIVTMKDLFEALLIPTNTILSDPNDHENFDYRITLVSSMQFIMFYGTGLLLAILRSAATKQIQDFDTIDQVYLYLNTIVRLALLKVQLIFDYSEREECKEVLIRLFSVFNVLYVDLSKLIQQPAKVIGSTNLRQNDLKYVKFS